MKLRTLAPSWFSDDSNKEAKCASFPATQEYDPWYGEVNGEDRQSEMDEAKKICLGIDDGIVCPLLAQCLEFALVNNERHGVWGGTNPDERMLIRRKRRLDWQQSPE